MTSTINATTTGGGGVVTTADASGNLALQGAGVTQITVTSTGVTLASALPVAQGGTGATTSTGSGAVVLGTSPTLTSPIIGITSFADYWQPAGSSATQATVAFQALGTDTNINVSLTPKGTGAIIAGPIPDGTATGGNARGANAIDLQTIRTSASQVAAAANSVVIGSNSNASGLKAIAKGNTAQGNASNAIAIGTNSFTHSYYGAGVAMAIGYNAAAGSSGSSSSTSWNTALGPYAATNNNFRDVGIASTALGYYANTNWKTGSIALGNGRISSSGDSQVSITTLRGTSVFSSAATVSTSGLNGISTVTFATQSAAPLVGSTVVVSGVTPLGYNGTYIVLSSSTTSVTYANPTTGTQTVAGTIKFTSRLTADLATPGYTNIANLPQNSQTYYGSITGVSGTGTIATVTFAALGSAPVVGSSVSISGISPSGYNGTYAITASTTTSISFASYSTGAYVSGGSYSVIVSLSPAAFKMNIEIVGRDTTTVNAAGSWTITALVSQGATPGSISIIGTPVVTTNALSASWSSMTTPSLTADTVFGGLNLVTFPVSSTSCHWVASVTSTEVW